MHFANTIAVLACFAPALAAQTTLVLPAEFERAWGRTSTSALGGNVTHTQMLFANPFPAGTVVFGIGLRDSTGTTDGAAFTADVEVQMSSTAAVPGAMSSTFAANIGSDVVTVLPRQTVNIAAMPANRGTGLFTPLMFTTPFVFAQNGQPNILIDLYVYSRSTGASWSTDRAFASTNGRATNTGIGCGAGTITSTTTGGTYVAGATVAISLASGPVNGVAALVYSFDQKEFAPGVPLPVNLGLLGAAANCDLMVDTSQGLNILLTDGAGAASMSFVVPPGVASVGVGTQYAYLVPPTAANPAGIEITNNRAIWIGPEVVAPNAQYVYDLFSTTTATGTATVNAVPIVQFML